jgi:signal transduction histidine kinase
VEEALANVAKHAHAEGAMVTVWRVGGTVVAEIVDDGIGGAVPADGSGLRRVAAGLEALSGRLEVDSEPGAGTRVRAVIPV